MNDAWLLDKKNVTEQQHLEVMTNLTSTTFISTTTSLYRDFTVLRLLLLLLLLVLVVWCDGALAS